MSLIQEDLVTVAYKKLKQMVYYEKTHLFLRKRLAEFECADDFEMRLENVKKVIYSDKPTDLSVFHEWLGEINFSIIPKGVKTDETPSKDQGTFITNLTSQANYEIEKVNYFFDGPIELHLLAVLWLMIQGPKLDNSLSRNCMGNRLHSLVGKFDDHSAHLFKKYHEQYAKWRDDGINKARDLLIEEKRSVCIIALDLQEYYYRVQVDWEKLRSKLKRRRLNIGKTEESIFQRENLGERLFDCIESIFKSYHQQIASHLSITHPDLPASATCLPIGLCVSSLIANWYLNEFDEAILAKVRPAYYGRYVDDILLVVTSEFASKSDPIRGFMDDVLASAGVLKWQEDEQRYELISKPGLYLQKKKCIVQFFEASHSIAGLEKFKKEIEENASDFALLPVEGDDSPVEQVAYDILYEGSANKLRSVKEIAENRWELAKHLTKLTELYLVSGGDLNQQMKMELFRFFKGRNAIDYWDMWERVIAFLVISGNSRAVVAFSKAIKTEVGRVRCTGAPGITKLLKAALVEHLEISLELSWAVKKADLSSKPFGGNLWRRSNLIRHHLVGVPLLNYTAYRGDLATPEAVVEVELDKKSIKFSPRFVHFDECLGFNNSGFVAITNADPLTEANLIYARFHGSKLGDVSSKLVKSQPRPKI